EAPRPVRPRTWSDGGSAPPLGNQRSRGGPAAHSRSAVLLAADGGRTGAVQSHGRAGRLSRCRLGLDLSRGSVREPPGVLRQSLGKLLLAMAPTDQTAYADGDTGSGSVAGRFRVPQRGSVRTDRQEGDKGLEGKEAADQSQSVLAVGGVHLRATAAGHAWDFPLPDHRVGAATADCAEPYRRVVLERR